MLPTFKSFYNNTLKTFKESVDLDSLPTFKDPNTIHDHITIENGEKFIKGSIYFSEQQLTKLPDLSDVKVLGGFVCYDNQLQTLKGAPKYVGKGFHCDDNQLQTLEGAPEYVGGRFNCYSNQLQTLKGAPKYVGGWFNCVENDLQTLEGAPEYVGGDFECGSNQLQTLKGLPKYIGGNLYWNDTKVTMEDFYENLLLSDVKGDPMARDFDRSEYPQPSMSNEEAYSVAKAYKLHNTPSDYTIDF